MFQKHENPAGENGRASGGMDSSQCEPPTLFPLPEPVNPAPNRRNVLAARDRQTPEYLARDRCYNPIGEVMRALRYGRPLSKPRQCELGVASPAELVWILRPAFRRLMRFYGVKRFRDLLPLYGKKKGCWQFDHLKNPAEIDPADEDQLLARSHVSNIEPVTWLENVRRRYAGKREAFLDALGLYKEKEESWN